MSEGNHSVVTEFFLTGFPGLSPEYEGIASAVMFFVYFFTVTGNATIIFLFATDRSLHKPIYYIILNLCVCDMLFSTTALPKAISIYWFQSETISFTGCFVQMYFVHYFGTVNSYILFLMALDRYLAICYPLRYPAILKNSTIHILSISAWLFAKIGPVVIVIRAYPLPYCASNVIHHCFCDHYSITTLTCTDRTPYAILAFGMAMVTLLVPLGFIIFSYSSIMITVLKIADLEGRRKSLSTCTPQLMVISLYYLPRCVVYFATTVGIELRRDIAVVIITVYSLCPPMINPIIYCLRAKDMKESFWKKFHRRTASRKAQISSVSH
ncbi:olfactory receptor 2AT4-like [Notolabrus celidotus]|uniref:olfactory receptor 2AT4-like n=1 Tax=Notolabrus celidotus TaxID=1203425 RepID=UPI00148F53C4|nr:olfactory receptor 2AT4-like [Notolabrus celidotus]